MVFFNSDKSRYIFFFGVLLNVLISLHIAQNFPSVAVEQTNLDTSYIEAGKNLFQHGVFSLGELNENGELKSTAYRPPIYGVISGFFSYLAGNEYSVTVEYLRWFNVLSNVILLYMTYRIGLFYGENVARIALILSVISLSSINFANNYHTSDSFFAMLLSFMVWSFIKFFRVKELKFLLWASLFLGLASLTRAAGYFLWLPLLILILVYGLQAFHWKKAVAYALLFMLIQAICIGGWQVRNHYTVGSSEFATMAGQHMLIWNAAYLRAYQNGTTFHEERQKLREQYANPCIENAQNEGDASICQKKIGFEIIFDSPLDYVVTQFRSLPRQFLFSPMPFYLLPNDQIREEIEEGPLVENFFNSAHHLNLSGTFKNYLVLLQNYPFFSIMLVLIAVIPPFIFVVSFLGVYAMLRQKFYVETVLMILFVTYFLAVITPTVMLRFRTSVMFVLTVGAAFALVWIYQWVKNNQKVEMS